MPATWIVVAITLGYLALSLAIGMWPGRRASGTAAGYVAGDRTLEPVLRRLRGKLDAWMEQQGDRGRDTEAAANERQWKERE